ncbi:MAG: DUF1156 domain-containing protein [Thermoplasmatales archaeon]|nr:DUF1156 domain-containing protein [Thermoplasmatales archaeon]
MKKRFIEWDMPLAEISGESAREKNIHHGHISTLHIWWARRPLASSRATNFAALIDLPEDHEKRKEITELIKKITPWEAVKNGNDANIKKAQEMIKEQWGDQPPKVLDPFAGGGSIPLEALRLGCETYASDYNPVAVLIEKATLEWPQKFGLMIPHPEKIIGIDGEIEKVNFLVYMVQKWANNVLKEAIKEIGHFYPEEPDGSTPVAYIWARTIPCQKPSCGAEIPLIRQFWLAKKDGNEVAYRPVIDQESKKINFEILEGTDIDANLVEGTISGGTVRCPVCRQTLPSTEIRRLAAEGKMGERMVVVVTKHPTSTGKSYRVATESDISVFNKAAAYLREKIANWPFFENPLPDEKIRTPDGKEVVDTSGSFFVHLQPVLYGLSRFQDLINSRQKLALVVFMEKIKSLFDKIKEDCQMIDSCKIDSNEAAKIIMGYLGIGLSRMVDRNTTLCIWNNIAQKTEHTFGRQALPMTWDYSETNVFGNQGWGLQFGYTLSPLTWLSSSEWEGYGKVENLTAASLSHPDNYFDAVLTDPPYYDNIPYADLADLFYVWLKRCLGDIFTDLFSTPLTPKIEECIENESLLRRSSNIATEEYTNLSIKNKYFFDNYLTNCFKEIHRVLKPNGIATIIYAHKTTAGWETMLNSLVNAGLVVTASWPIHTERSGRLRGQGSAALASSIYMVCRKREREKVGFYSEIQPQIKERIETKLQQFWNEGIAGGDFFISAIGPGMEIFSQYERVEKLSGEQVTTDDLLKYIRSVSTDFIVRKLLTDASSAKIDKESEFYLAYRWTYLDNTVEYDDARKLASASGVSLEKLWGPGGFVKKSGSNISVMGPKERGDVDPIKSMVDVMHKSLLLWEKGKKEELSELLAQTGYADNPAFKQFCQAVLESLLNGNKEKQLLEGFLIGIDTYKRGEVKVPKAQTKLKEFGGY